VIQLSLISAVAALAELALELVSKVSVVPLSFQEVVVQVAYHEGSVELEV